MTGNGLADIQQRLRALENMRVLVGVPDDGKRKKDEVSNAELAFIHTHGSPVRKIPPRPFIEPGVEDAREKIAGRMKAAAEAALDGRDATAELDKAGIYAENAAKDYIGSGRHAPNSPETVKRKGSSVPLIDTGSLRQSITHIVEGK